MISLLAITIKDKSDALNAYTTYFNEGSWPGFGGAICESVLIALAVVLLGIIIFYYVIGNSSYKCSTLTGWFVTFFAVGIVTFFSIQLNTGIHTKGYGFPLVIEKQYKKIVPGLEPDSQQKIMIDQSYATLKKNCKKGIVHVKPLYNLCLYTALSSILVFFIVSLIAKHGPTKYCRNIPLKASTKQQKS